MTESRQADTDTLVAQCKKTEAAMIVNGTYHKTEPCLKVWAMLGMARYSRFFVFNMKYTYLSPMRLDSIEEPEEDTTSLVGRAVAAVGELVGTVPFCM